MDISNFIHLKIIVEYLFKAIAFFVITIFVIYINKMVFCQSKPTICLTSFTICQVISNGIIIAYIPLNERINYESATDS